MKGSLPSIFAAAALAATPLAFAQQPGEPQAPAEPPSAQSPLEAPGAAAQSSPVSDSELETFADIYVELQDTIAEYETKLAEATSEEETFEAQSEMQRQGMQAIEEHGWTPEQYNRIVQAMSVDSALLERAIQFIDERS